jgi:hypothetical protein
MPEGIVAVTPSPVLMTPSQARRANRPVEAEKFMERAKAMVVANYNDHRDVIKSPELTPDMIYIVWFSKILGNWKTIIASGVVRGILWEVTFNGHKEEFYMDVYKKLNNFKIPAGGTE